MTQEAIDSKRENMSQHFRFASKSSEITINLEFYLVNTNLSQVMISIGVEDRSIYTLNVKKTEMQNFLVSYFMNSMTFKFDKEESMVCVNPSESYLHMVVLNYSQEAKKHQVAAEYKYAAEPVETKDPVEKLELMEKLKLDLAMISIFNQSFLDSTD